MDKTSFTFDTFIFIYTTINTLDKAIGGNFIYSLLDYGVFSPS